MKDSCNKQRLACPYCILEEHSDHTSEKINVEFFWNHLSGKYHDRFRALEGLNRAIVNMKDLDMLQEFKTEVLRSLDEIKDALVGEVDKFKVEFPV